MGVLGSTFSDEAHQTTINATTITLLTRTLDADSAGLIRLRGIARRIDGVTKAFSFGSVGFRESGGITLFNNVLDLLGTTGDLLTLLTATMVVDVSGGDIRVRATGIAATEIDWAVVIEGVQLVHS